VGPGTWAAPAIGAALRHSAERPDAYVVQAAVAACHALAPLVRQHQLGRDDLLVRRAYRRCGHSGRPAQPGGAGGSVG
jgi:hypothetical protein